MRSGQWPQATVDDVLQGLDWELRKQNKGGRPNKICEVSFLDFAGEVYRAAFGKKSRQRNLAEEVKALKEHIREADKLLVLINLSDVINHGVSDARVAESMWITSAILDFALPDEPGDGGRDHSDTCIVLSQADNYSATIKECGGALGALRKYLPHVAADYDWLEIFPACAVDKTVLSDEGDVVPAGDYTPSGLRPIMEWIVKETSSRTAKKAAKETASRAVRKTAKETSRRAVPKTAKATPDPLPMPSMPWSRGFFENQFFFFVVISAIEGSLFAWIFPAEGWWRLARWILFLFVSLLVLPMVFAVRNPAPDNEECNKLYDGAATMAAFIGTTLALVRLIWWWNTK